MYILKIGEAEASKEGEKKYEIIKKKFVIRKILK